MELAGLEDYIREEDNQRFRSSTFMDEQSDSDSEGSYDDDDAFVNSAFLGGERLLDPKGRRIELQDSHTWANKPVEHSGFDDTARESHLSSQLATPLLVSDTPGAEELTTKKPMCFGFIKDRRDLTIKLMYLTQFLTSISFAIVMPTLQNYVLRFGGDTGFFGACVSFYAIAQLCASPLFGIASNRRSAKDCLILALILVIVGNIMYSLAPGLHQVPETIIVESVNCTMHNVGAAAAAGQCTFMRNMTETACSVMGNVTHSCSDTVMILPTNATITHTTTYLHDAKIYILFARIITGLGAGVVAVCRAYVSNVTSLKERTSAMAIMSASQGLGYCAGPFLGATMSPLGPGSADSFTPNMYTGAGYLGAILSLANVILLQIYFVDYRDIYKEIKEKKAERRARRRRRRQGIVSTITPEGAVLEDETAVAVSSGPKLSAEAQHLSDLQNHPDAKVFDKGAAGAICFMFFSAALVFALNETLVPPLVQDEYGWTPEQTTRNTGLYFAIGGLIGVVCFMAARPLSNRFGERYILLAGLSGSLLGVFLFIPYGPPSYTLCLVTVASWCAKTPTLQIDQFYVASMFIFLFYPFASVICIVLFSKILGPAPQGAGMGMLTAAGSAARALGPIILANVYDNAGLRATMIVICVLIGAAIVVFVVFFKRLLPHVLLRPPPKS